MKRLSPLLVRLLLSLTLLVASWPVASAETVCEKSPQTTQQACNMPCCQNGHRMAHCSEDQTPRLTATHSAPTLTANSCGCQLTSGEATLPAPSPVKVRGDNELPVAIQNPRPISFAALRSVAEPGIVGTDSGPPPTPPQRVDQGRAPPVG